MNDIAVLVTQYLDFDVARIGDKFFDENTIVAETRFRFGAGTGEIFLDLGLGERDAHALAAAAGGSLDHHRVANLLGDGDGLLIVFDYGEMTGDGRYLGARRRLFRFDLVAHGGDGLGIGTDKHDSSCRQRGGESRPLGEKATPRMPRPGAPRPARRA